MTYHVAAGVLAHLLPVAAETSHETLRSHLSMRLQHAKQAAGGLPADEPDQLQVRTAIIEQVERLRWRTWNGKAKNARITLKRLRTLIPACKGEPARKLLMAA